MENELVKDQAPLRGAIMCCTSILPEERYEIQTAAEEMGAIHKYDLTSDVTHLVVGDVDTAKYRYVAKERPDVRVVMPSFVNAVRQVWMAGGDVDLAALEKEHKAPTLLNLKICLTGFESTSARDNIKSHVVNSGGEFHGDLTKSVTHLIVAAPEGKKYDHARRWQIKCVSIEWLQDSVQRGMALEETLYDPILAPQDRGVGAFNKQALENVTLGKRPREEEKAPEPPARRKLRRTMSKKMASQQETIWADLAQTGSGQAKQEDWQPPEIDSVLVVLPRPGDTAEPTPDDTIEPTKRRSSPPQQRPQHKANSIFEGRIIYTHAFEPAYGFPPAKAAKLHAHLRENGARLCTSLEELEIEDDGAAEIYIVFPSAISPKKLQSSLKSYSELEERMKVVTEWWVESCLHGRRFLDPEECLLSQPIHEEKVEGFDGLTVCSTGFADMDLLHVSRVVSQMGAKYSEYLQAGVNVLVFNSSMAVNKDKLDFAASSSIPAVTEQWLLDSIDRGIKQDPAQYLVENETPTVPVNFEPSRTKTAAFKHGTKSRPGQLELQGAAPTKAKAPQRSKAAAVQKPKHKQTGPFYEDDDDDAPALPPDDASQCTREASRRQPSQPLGELSQEQQNSQRRGSQSMPRSQNNEKDPRSPTRPQNENVDTSSAAVHLVDAAKAVPADPAQATLAPPGPATQARENLNTAIADLLAKKQSATRRPSSEQPPQNDLLRRRRLGRAPSGGSFNSVGSNISQDERREPAPLPDPSQKIIYEDEKAVEERRALIQRMGGKVDEREEKGRRVESIGTVKDASTGLAGGRGKRAAAGARRR